MPEVSSSGLGRAVGRGFSWAAIGTAWAKIASLVAQIVLGVLLTGEEWGVYAIAISVTAFVYTFRDGGVRELLVQRGQDQYSELRGPVFWIALSINGLIGGVLALGATHAATFYGQPDVRDLIWVLAITVVLDTPAQVLRAKLRIDLRFATYAKLDMVSATLRYGGAIALAALGFGPLSFVIPLPVIALVEWAVLTLATRDNLFATRPQLTKWWVLLGEVKWLLFGSVVGVLSTMGDYVVLGRLAPATVVGVYYFAFQLSVHASMLAAANVNTVLMPALVRLVGQPERQRKATIRALRALLLIASPLSLGLVAIIDPLEQLIWGGRWQAAVGVVQVLGVMLPVRLSFMVATSSLKARGRFQAWALLSLIQGLGLVATATSVGYISNAPTIIATAIAGYWLVASPLTLWLALRGVAQASELAAALLPSWLLTLACGAACLVADTFVLSNVGPIPRTAALALLFSLLFLGSARTILRSHIDDTLSVLPGKIATLVRHVLFLPRN